MFPSIAGAPLVKTTSYKVVTPFYLYAALSFLVATIILLGSSDAFFAHYFQPHILAITHLMALGWGTMVILGASHQMVPVLIEGKLFREWLGYVSFVFSAVGIPLLVYGFYIYDMGTPALWGGRLVLLSLLVYLINIGMSILKSKRKNVHAVFVFAATLWLFATAFLGLTLVYNFKYHFLPVDSIYYLPLHAHIGIIGWFLLLVIGVASRLIPMFLISKYTHPKTLWIIFWLINAAIVLFILIFFYFKKQMQLTIVPAVLLLGAGILFVKYCYAAYKQRIRRNVDPQVRLSLLSAAMIILPIILFFLILFIFGLNQEKKNNVFLAYGFLIFFGWLTAIILGMTFKTLPFIVWNKVYHRRAKLGKAPNPKDLFSNSVFKVMGVAYLIGLTAFVAGMMCECAIVLKGAASLLILTAILYTWNVLKILYHKPKMT